MNANGAGSGSQVWTGSTSFGKPARLVSSPNPSFPLDLSDLPTAGLKVSLDAGGELFESTLNVPSKTFADRTELVGELNSLVSANGTLKNKIIFKTNDLGELVMRSAEGGASIQLSVDNADPGVNIVTRLGFVANSQQQGQRASNTDLINSLANIGQDLSDGDVLRFSGVKPSGERFDSTFTFNEGTSDTVADLFSIIESVYGGVTAWIPIRAS